MKRYVLTSFLVMLFLVPVVSASNSVESDIEIDVNMLKGIRNQVPYTSSIQILYNGTTNDSITVMYVEVIHRNKSLLKLVPEKKLSPVGKELREYNELASTLRSKKSTNVGQEEAYLRLQNILSKISTGIFREKIIIDPTKIFKDNFRPGNAENLTFIIRFTHDGETYTLSKDFTIKVLRPLPQILVPSNESLNEQSGGDMSPLAQQPGTKWYYGDLHVHDGYNSWIGGYDGKAFNGDECGVELESLYGYTIPELRSQALGLGAKWLTMTDHSYCIENLEWNHVIAESTASTDGSFLVIPGLEVSVDDNAPDDGSDDETFCIPPLHSDDRAAHLGAHDISTYMAGGVCDQSSGYTAQGGINVVKSQGGLPIIHHPEGGDFHGIEAESWDWETRSSTSGETGVEIWNGETPDSGSIDFWVDRLLRGDHSYAFGGSDTHSQMTNNVWNGAYFTDFTVSGLKNALKQGHSFVTNDPALVLWGYKTGDPFEYLNHLMGNIIPITSGDEVTIKIYYDTGYDEVYGNIKQGTITLHKGRINSPSEDVESGWPKTINLDGSIRFGNVYFVDSPASDSYYRAEINTGGYEWDGSTPVPRNYYAFTNPIWVEIEGVPICPSANETCPLPDTTAPTIYNTHHDPASPSSSESIHVYADIIDDTNVSSAVVWYTTDGSNWQSIPLIFVIVFDSQEGFFDEIMEV